MAAGLILIYSKRHLFPELPEQKLNERINACVQKGGFDFCLKGYHDEYEEFQVILLSSVKLEIPIRPGLLRYCYLRLANYMAEGLSEQLINPDKIYSARIMTLEYFWQGIVAGLPEAVWRFNIFVNIEAPTPDALVSDWEVDLTKNPLEEPAQGLLFRIFFAAQQS